MKDSIDRKNEGVSMDEGLSGRLERITELKEALKHTRGMSEEMSLLGDLTREISALRQFLEPRY